MPSAPAEAGPQGFSGGGRAQQARTGRLCAGDYAGGDGLSNEWSEKRAHLAAISLVLIGFVARVFPLSRVADNDDAPLFIRGVVRFSVAEGRPHWPGYPVYIAAGKLAAAVVGDPAFALQIVSAAASAAIAWPLYWIVRAWALSLGATPGRAARAGLCASVLWLATPISWVTGSQIISDPLGLFLGVVVVALCIRGETEGTARPWMVAALLGGAMIGVRLVNVSLLGPLAWKAWVARRERWWGLHPAIALTTTLSAGIAPWLAWLASHDVTGYVHAGEMHLAGHFTRFGESIWTDAHPAERPAIALRTVALYGLGAGGPPHGGLRVFASLVWAVTLVTASTLRPWRGRVAILIGLWMVPHLAYVFLGHDVALARYGLSASLAVVLWASLAAATAKPTGVIGPALAALTVVAVSLPLAVHQGRQPPVEYQAARYLARSPRGAVVLATRSEVLLGVYAMLFGDRVMVLEAQDGLPALAGQANGRALYRTSMPPGDSAGWIPVAHFCRDPMIEPLIATELWLFRAGTPDANTPLPACGEER